MLVPSRRLAAASVVAATLIALPAAAFASGSSTPSGKPAPSATVSKSGSAHQAPAAGKSAAPDPSAAAMKAAARQSGTPDRAAQAAMVAALASRLGVTHSAAQHAFGEIDALSGSTGVDPAGQAFAVIARELGVSPARLAAALDAANQAARQAVTGR